MKFQIKRVKPVHANAELLLVGVYKNALSGGELLSFKGHESARLVAQAAADKFTGKLGQVSSQFANRGRVVLFGLGDRNTLSRDQLRDALEAGFKEAKRLKVSTIAVAEIDYREGGPSRALFGRLVGEVAGLVDYAMLNFKTEKGGHKKEARFSEVTVVVGNAVVDTVPSVLPLRGTGGYADGLLFNRESDEELAAGMAEGFTIATAVNEARDLVVLPPDICTPAELARRAQQIADGSAGSVTCRLYQREELKAMGANAFLAVAQGSDAAPVLIELTYYPASADANVTLALIGKSVTFDTGGYDLKPADGMRWMKGDMAGGAATLMAMQAIAALKLPVRVKVVMAATDNMVSHTAFRPSEVLHSLNGMTIEVDNTDAEGRLTLADAIEFAKRQGVTHIVDVATLTGAIKAALGTLGAGAFTNNDELFGKLEQACARSGELVHRFPMWPGYARANESKIADLKNSGGAAFGAGSITAAWFLRKFAGETPWIHLDIAGVGVKDEEGTGWGVRSLVELARLFAEQPRKG